MTGPQLMGEWSCWHQSPNAGRLAAAAVTQASPGIGARPTQRRARAQRLLSLRCHTAQVRSAAVFAAAA